MSAVSAESPRGSADLSTSVSSPQAADERASNGVPAGQADFGPNQWLVDELYQRYQADPGSVDQAWWSFFADYHPLPDSASTPTAARTSPAAAPPAPKAPPPAPKAPAPATLADGQSATAATAITAERTTSGDGQRGPAAPAPARPQAPGTAAAADGSGLAAAGTVAPSAARTTPVADAAEHVVRLRGAAARTAANMTASLTVPTATSVRARSRRNCWSTTG